MYISLLSGLGSIMTYREFFGLTFVANFALFWFVAGAVSIVMNFLGKRYSPKIQNSNESEISHIDESITDNSKEILLKDRYKKKSSQYREDLEIRITGNNLKHQAFRYLGSLSSWISWIFFACLPAWLSGFGLIPLWAGILLSFVVLVTRFCLSLYFNCPIFILKEGGRAKLINDVLPAMLELHPKKVKVGFVLLTFIAIFFNLATYKSCFLNHVDRTFEMPFYNKKYLYSSALTRYVSLPKACPPGPPCQLYATLPFDTATSVFLNIHTHVDVKKISINYETKQNHLASGNLTQKLEVNDFISPSAFDIKGERNIYSVLLSNLNPETNYVFEIFYNGKSQKNFTYSTLPSPTSKNPYNLIYGGDIGLSSIATDLTKIAKEQDPLAMVIGGDFAYDNGEPSCSYVLDQALKMFEDLVNKPLHRLVPLIISVGNHDVGWDSLATVSFSRDENAPSYYSSFPQHVAEDEAQGTAVVRVPKISERKTYHAHMIGNILNVVLDPGYVSLHGGEQRAWMESVSQKYNENPKFSIYHDPIISPCKYAGAAKSISEGILNWVSTFDRYNYMTSFDNHFHFYKRTHQLRGMVVSPGDGTVYLGSGAWGVDVTVCKFENEQGYFTKMGSLNHIWVLRVNPADKKVNYKSILLNRTVYEDFTLPMTH